MEKDRLDDWMERLGIQEGDLIEKFVLGSGSGGQKINKTSSCVYLKHVPTGVEIKCQKTRSREENRYWARVELCRRLQAQIQKVEQERRAYREKVRRQTRSRSQAVKERMLKEKKVRSRKKILRSSPHDD